MQNQNTTSNYHSTDTVNEVELGEQVFTVTRQDDIGLAACSMPYGNILTCGNTVFKILQDSKRLPLCSDSDHVWYDTPAITFEHYATATSYFMKHPPKTIDVHNHFAGLINQSSL